LRGRKTTVALPRGIGNTTLTHGAAALGARSTM
jgi:hypothetical protein